MSQNDEFTWSIYGKQVLAAIKHGEDHAAKIEEKVSSNHKEIHEELTKFREAMAQARIDMTSMLAQIEVDRANMAGDFRKEIAVMKTKLNHRTNIINGLTAIASAIGVALIAIFK